MYLTLIGRTVDVSTMDSTTAPPLDLEKFLKLLTRSRSTLHGGGADPERTLAREKAERMALDAGLSFEAAVDLAEGRTTSPGSAQAGSGWGFSDFFAEERRKREQAQRHSFPETDLERQLREGLAGHKVLDDVYEDDPVTDLIRTVIPWPGSIRKAVDEINNWYELQQTREKIVPNYRLGNAAMRRRWMLANFILEAKAVTLDDAVARARWALTRDKFECISWTDSDEAQRKVLGDLERMADRIRSLSRENTELRTESTAQTEKPLRRSNADKRQAVEAVLQEPGGDTLSLRAVADRAGVSPEFVRRVKAARKRVKR